MMLATRPVAAIAAALLATTLATPVAFAADSARGADLYNLCAMCHGTAGEGNSLALAPAISA